MDVKIVKKESFSVLGKVGQGPAHLGKEWIPLLWEKANGNYSEISALVKHDESGKIAAIWGLMSDPYMLIEKEYELTSIPSYTQKVTSAQLSLFD
jgi:hypothetical protein